jgi:inward rectifier potassium channel
MALRSKINRRAQLNAETGLGVNSSNNSKRFFDKNGDPHIKIRGNSFVNRLSIYQTMLKMPMIKFLAIIATAYLLVNLVFASIYFSIGPEHLGGMDARTMNGKFWEAFFFSAQTLSTVGYGHVFPMGFITNAIAAIESLLGLLMFAVATGLMYGRFSNPKAYILFSKNAVVAPFKDGIA